MKHINGIKLLEEGEGEGRAAQKGDRLVFNSRMYLNGGDEVALNERQAAQTQKGLIRVEDDVTYIDHRIVFGQRQAIAGIEQALLGIKAGAYRTVRIWPIETKGCPI